MTARRAREVVTFVLGVGLVVLGLVLDRFAFASLGAGMIGVPGAFGLLGGRSLRLAVAGDRLVVEAHE